MPHFGAILGWDEFHALAARIRAAGVGFVIEPRYGSRAGPPSRRRCSSWTPAPTHSSSRRSAGLDTCSRREACLDRRRRGGGDRRLRGLAFGVARRARDPRPRQVTGSGGGSTGAATGGFRAQFATAINVRLSLLARAKLLAFREEVGADPGYAQAGYLWIAEDDAALAALRAARVVQHAEGLTEAVEVGPDDVFRLQPGIARDGIAGGAYCPTDGYIRPRQISRATSGRLGVPASRSSGTKR